MKPFHDLFRPYNAIQPTTLWGISPKITTKSYRTERDSLGEILIPTNALWSTTTQRCLEHFYFENLPFNYQSPSLLILSLVIIKKAAGYANHKNGLLPTYKWLALCQAADEILSGHFLADHFPLSLWQTGSLSHTHINVNEVLMNRSNQIIQESIAYCMNELIDGDDASIGSYDITIDKDNYVSASANYHRTESIQYLIAMNAGDDYIQTLKSIFAEIPSEMIDNIRHIFFEQLEEHEKHEREIEKNFQKHLKHHTPLDDGSHHTSETILDADKFPTPPSRSPEVTTSDANNTDGDHDKSTDRRPSFHAHHCQYDSSSHHIHRGVNAEIRDAASPDLPITHHIEYTITIPTIPIRIITAPSPTSCRHSGSPFDAPVKMNDRVTSKGFPPTLAFNLWERLSKIVYQIVPLLKHSDDINACQSSNCVIPSAIRIAAVYACDRLVHYALPGLIKAFHDKAEHASKENLIKLGRTHLQDAVALRYAEEFQSYCHQLQYWQQQIAQALNGLFGLPLGGTAVGNGCNAYTTFAADACDRIAYYTEDTLQSSKLSNVPPSPYSSPALQAPVPHRKFHSLGSSPFKMTSVSAVNEELTLSHALSGLASCLYKIANDIRFTSCGPRGGIQETAFTNFEAGSSIMPKKNNPTQCEQLIMVCAKIQSDAQLLWQANTGGQMQLNACRPITCYGLLDAGILLEQSITKFTKYAIVPLQFNTEVIQTNTNSSLMLSTMLTPVYGYQAVSFIVKHAEEHGQTLKEALFDLDYISTDEEYDKLINLDEMIQPLPIEDLIDKRTKQQSVLKDGSGDKQADNTNPSKGKDAKDRDSEAS